MAGELAFKDEATLKRLFLLDYFRGPDSTGLARIKKSGEANVLKIASHPIDFFDLKKYSELTTTFQTRAWIGHNRSATKGAVNNLNAHPFQYGHITGAHNGTLLHSSWKDLEKATGEEFNVDSQALIYAIYKLGVEEAMKLAAGAWSLVWYDQNEDSLNFLRNNERPMWYCYTKEFDKLAWASEWHMLDSALRLQGGYELYHDEGNYRYFPTEVDVHYKYSLSELKASSERPKPLAKTVKGKEPVPVTTVGHDPFSRTSGVANGGGTVTHIGTSKEKTKTSYGKSSSNVGTDVYKIVDDKPVQNIMHLFGSEKSPLAGWCTSERFEELSMSGCGWCGTTVDYGDHGITIIEKDGAVLCAECAGNKGATRILVDNFDDLLPK